jgi:CheY-like chemotaxis protein
MSPDALSRTDSATLAVLVVDDEASVADELADTLLRRGMRVMTAGNGIEALSVLAARPDIGVLLTDIRMPGLCGLDLAQQALEGREAADALEVLLITGYATPAHGIAASRIGAFGVLPKPVRAARLAELVAAARERAAVRRRAAAEFGARRFDPRPPARHPNDPIAAAEALLHSLASRSEDAGKLAQIAAQAEGPLAALCDARDADARAVRLSALLRQVVELAALEQGRLPGDVTRASAHAIIGAVAARLAAAGIPCRQRIILQPEATPAFQVNLQRLGRAFGLLVERALGDAPGAASADLALDAEASQGRIELTIRTPPMPAAPDSPPHALLPITLARRLVALDGGRLDAWLLPEGGLRARMILGAA